jgi:hypothetical protein
MIIFFECGRLGNQLFQYVILKELMPKQRLVFFGCEDLKKTISKVDATIIGKEIFPIWALYLIQIFFTKLANFGIIGSIGESWIDSSYRITTRRGVVPGSFLLRPSFFQNQTAISNIKFNININTEHLDVARAWLSFKKIPSKYEGLVFLHIRRGDYLSWPSLDFPAVLSREWYVRAINKIREKIECPIFLVLTDDRLYAEDIFGDESDIFISNNDQSIDFALMSLCSHGILSASSFAWWGASLSRHNKLNGVYLAPKYWAGHREKKWYPQDFVSSWITYIE